MTVECEAKVKEVIQRTYNVKSVRMVPAKAEAFKAGQFLSLSLKPEKDFTRYLSISNSPTETGYIEVTKKITDSGFSKMLNGLKAGDRVGLKYPMGSFTFGGDCAKIAFLSGGIGITPIRSICKFTIDSKIGTDMVLLYGNRTAADIAFGDDFERMAKEYDKLKVVHVLCEADNKYYGRIGLINGAVVKEDVPDYMDRRFFLCGPPAMVAALKKMLAEELKLPADEIVTENFMGY